MDYVAKFFDLLEIKPQERFKLKSTDNNKMYSFIYYFSDRLSLHYINNVGDDFKSDHDIEDILNGNLQIVKIPKISEEEEIAIKYFLLAGYKYMAKDRDGKVYAYKTKPIKSPINLWNCGDDNELSLVEIPINFLSWEDSEPYYIGE